MLPRSFYARPAKPLARDLIGKILVHKYRGKILRARIVETEAYVGAHDLACHASKGRTPRTEVMFGPAGHAYIYLIYGMYDMLNIVCSKIGDPQAVLIRAAEPMDGWRADLSGPGKICRAMRIIRSRDNGRDLTGAILFLANDLAGKKIRIQRTRRINVDYAGAWVHPLLRFYDPDSAAITPHPRPATG